MKNTRDIPVKALFSADEFLELQKECAAADVKHSPLLRNLALGWMTERKDSRRHANMELPACGHALSMSLPNRASANVNYGATHMRRRL